MDLITFMGLFGSFASIIGIITAFDWPDFIKSKGIHYSWFKRFWLTCTGRGPHSWYKKGNYLYCLRRFDEALEAYNQAIAISPGYGERIKYSYAWSLISIGEALFSAGRFDEALEAYNQAIEITPGLKAAWERKGVALGKLG